MKPLIHALLAKTGRDNGYENISDAIFETVVMSSARHRAELEVTLIDDHFSIRVLKGPLPLPAELFRSFADWPFEDKCFIAASEPLLAKFLRRSSELARWTTMKHKFSRPYRCWFLRVHITPRLSGWFASGLAKTNSGSR